MSADFKNNRKYERIFFGQDLRIECVATMAGSQATEVRGLILNLSEGGVHFTQERQGMKEIKQGDRITLKTVNGPEPLKFSRDIEMEVKWVLDHEFLQNIGYGCMFVDMPQDITDLIHGVVTDGVLGTKDG